MSRRKKNPGSWSESDRRDYLKALKWGNTKRDAAAHIRGRQHRQRQGDDSDHMFVVSPEGSRWVDRVYFHQNYDETTGKRVRRGHKKNSRHKPRRRNPSPFSRPHRMGMEQATETDEFRMTRGTAMRRNGKSSRKKSKASAWKKRSHKRSEAKAWKKRSHKRSAAKARAIKSTKRHTSKLRSKAKAKKGRSGKSSYKKNGRKSWRKKSDSKKSWGKSRKRNGHKSSSRRSSLLKKILSRSGRGRKSNGRNKRARTTFSQDLFGFGGKKSMRKSRKKLRGRRKRNPGWSKADRHEYLRLLKRGSGKRRAATRVRTQRRFRPGGSDREGMSYAKWKAGLSSGKKRNPGKLAHRLSAARQGRKAKLSRSAAVRLYHQGAADAHRGKAVANGRRKSRYSRTPRSLRKRASRSLRKFLKKRRARSSYRRR